MNNMQRTTRDTVKLLCQSVVTRLENRKAILFPAEKRQVVADEIVKLVGEDILTDQDLHEKTLDRMGANATTLSEADYSDNEQYRAARSIVRKEFGDDELKGLYFQKTLREISLSIAKYFMDSDAIEDVFESDNDIAQMIVEITQKFNPNNVH